MDHPETRLKKNPASVPNQINIEPNPIKPCKRSPLTPSQESCSRDHRLRKEKSLQGQAGKTERKREREREREGGGEERRPSIKKSHNENRMLAPFLLAPSPHPMPIDPDGSLPLSTPFSMHIYVTYI